MKMAATEQHRIESDSRQRLIVILGAIVLGYAIALSEALSASPPAYTPLQLATIIIIGLVYSYLLVGEEQVLGQHPSATRKTIYFAVSLGLLTLTFFLVGTINGIWLIAMPFIGTGVALLPRIWGWLLAAAVYISMLLPVVLNFGIDEAVNIGFSLAPAVIFVIVFVRLWTNAEGARQNTQKLADQLESANRQLATYLTQAEELATTKERNRVAREIHDSLGHYLTIINVQIEAARTIMDRNPEQASEALKKAQALTQEGLASVRQSVGALRESPLGNRSLTTAVKSLVEDARNAGLVAEFEIKGNGRPLEPTIELTFYRAAQEGLTNVRKHARASRVDVTIDFRGAKQVTLTIKDNGVGSSNFDNGGFGLLGVRERVKLLGGKIDLTTALGNGFEIKVDIPT